MKLSKNDYRNIGWLMGAFVLFLLLHIRPGHLYGSTVDWASQHTALPEYFRALFYETRSLLPDFAFHIGAGENIFNFAYYGLLSPVLLLSYALPFVPMVWYIIVSTAVTVMVSTVLFYKFLKNNGVGEKALVFASFLFLFSAGLTFHTHRHIMYINYMPFLILGLMGIDSFFKKGRRALLACSVFLLIMTSYFFSVTSILILVVYGIYKYLKESERFEFSEFFKTGRKLALPVLLGIGMACMLLLPTFYVIWSGRGETNTSLRFLDLLPRATLENILYFPYGPGLTSIALIALLHLFFTKRRGSRFLGAAICMFLFFTPVAYALNAGMYLDPKVFLPLLPVLCLITAMFADRLFQHGPDLRLKKTYIVFAVIFVLGLFNFGSNELLAVFDGPWITIAAMALAVAEALFTVGMIANYQKKRNLRRFTLPLVIFAAVFSFGVHAAETFVEQEPVTGGKYQAIENAAQGIDGDQIYRTAVLADLPLHLNLNRAFGEIGSFYTTTVYSSTSSQPYNRFFYDTVNNPVQHTDRTKQSANSNLLFNMLMGNRYLIADEEREYLGYARVKENDRAALLENEGILPVAYASSVLIGEDAFDRLQYPYNAPLLLRGIVVDREADETVPQSDVTKLECDIGSVDQALFGGEVRDGVMYMNLEEDQSFSVKLDERYKNTILFIGFRVLKSPTGLDSLGISINGTENMLPSEAWKYHNDNYHFDYQIGIGNETELEIAIRKGSYEITDLTVHALDYNAIKDAKAHMDPFLFDKESTKGDVVAGQINVKNDGYFTISVPYDNGFTITVDGKETEYEQVNKAFIGFPVSKGVHEIRIEYRAPLKQAGVIISALSFLLFFALVIIERKKRKTCQNKNTKKH